MQERRTPFGMTPSQSDNGNQVCTPPAAQTNLSHCETVEDIRALALDFRLVALDAREVNAAIREHLAKGGNLSKCVVPLSLH